MIKKPILSGKILFRWNQIFGALLVLALLVPVTVLSQWQGNPVTQAATEQVSPKITTDGNGGTIVTWQSFTNGKYEIFAQRMNSSGVAMWKTNGITICAQDSNYSPMIVSDDSGGAIIAWQSYRGSVTADIYAQRVNSQGEVLWSADGVPVSTVVFEQDTIAMISDGFGGVILTWQDYRSNNGYADIYAQRINSDGAMLWTANGVNICNQAAEQRGPKLISDGSGGAFITWYDNRAGDYDIYTQRVGSAGAVQWTTNGVATCTMASDQLKPDICTDGAGGFIITWYDFRSTTDYNIYAQRQGPSGAIVWVVDGVVMNNNVAYAQVDPMIVSDGMGGAIISWTDYRTGITADIYAQRVNTTGTVQWTATGVIICTSANDQAKTQIVSDGNNGAFITWQDDRNIGNSDIYAQRIASNAAINWPATGYLICAAADNQSVPMLVSNGDLGAIVVWQDFRNGFNSDIYETGFNISGLVSGSNEGSVTPDKFTLSQNYPNPFNPSTRINYTIPAAGSVKITIYDAIGRNIDVLVNQNQLPGTYNVVWNAANLPSGVYIYKIEAGSFTDTKKMILIK
jgi:predicted lipoprotein with Yx(FWY)xxD motif